jgi:pimeloyl-ACP methyl ester carboxylesterase
MIEDRLNWGVLNLMMRLSTILLVAMSLSVNSGSQQRSAEPQDRGSSFVTVAPGVRLEVKDWGGTGRPVVLLAGLGGTLHAYDSFAPQLAKKYHVIGITRRGFGASSAPEAAVAANYDADRLGDDVISVLKQMNIEHPVLIGHSFAGEELSSVCSRYPNVAAGLVYLDAANRYAFSPVHRGDFRIDTLELRRELNASLNAISPAESKKAIDGLQELLPQFEADLLEQKELYATAPEMSPQTYADEARDRSTAEGRIQQAALDGERRYTKLNCPVLAIFALPHDHGLPPGPKRDATDAWEIQTFGPLVDSFQAGVPSARVVRLAHAKHQVYDSNPVEVTKEIDEFIAGLDAKKR